MSPLIGLAVHMLPDLALHLTRDKSPRIQAAVVQTMHEVLKTDDAEQARKLIEDPALDGELRVRLAEITAEARAAEIAAETARQQALYDDRADARQTFAMLVRAESAFAWGAVAVSVIVALGFFLTLGFLISGGFAELRTDPVVFQVINIAVGALTAAFATVVSFWLGSSDSSRRKELSLARAQADAAAAQTETARTARQIVVDQAVRTEKILDRVVTAPAGAPRPASPPTPAATAKDAHQFRRCVDIIFRHEGGYVDHDKDPGGATNMGITLKTLSSWRDCPVSKEDVRALTREEAAEIYRVNYWNALNCDQLPAGLDLVVFDFGVNAGVRRAAKLLQRLVHVAEDGQIGPITLAAVAQMVPAEVIDAISDGRLDFYRSLAHWSTFGKGWARRTEATRTEALAMSQGPTRPAKAA